MKDDDGWVSDGSESMNCSVCAGVFDAMCNVVCDAVYDVMRDVVCAVALYGVCCGVCDGMCDNLDGGEGSGKMKWLILSCLGVLFTDRPTNKYLCLYSCFYDWKEISYNIRFSLKLDLTAYVSVHQSFYESVNQFMWLSV